ncbi:MAG: DUF6538 domain-containing protein [Xanthobacteraceae bacterium]
MYIYRRGGAWWFRKAVPVDLSETLGLQDVRHSLRTASKTVAGHKALRMAGALFPGTLASRKIMTRQKRILA